MNPGFYLKMARTNLIRNRRFYVPQILTGAGLLACFYIIYTMAMDSHLANVRGGSYLQSFMTMGVFITAGLTIVLLLYTNSFLMKQRKQELGLYNVLGMEKKHIGQIVFFESALSSLCVLVLGLVTGMVFYKFCSLLISRLLDTEIIAGIYYITPKTIVPVLVFFVLVYLVIFAINRGTIRRLKPVEMLASRHAGEKEPKVRWIILVLGILTLGAGYYIALTTESPLQAIRLFFVAVIMVIIGTYLLYMAGSIFVLRLLKKNEKYYYHKYHMVTISSLIYRMKQNAVGLASISVLGAFVLAMISSTVSLYSGIQGLLDSYFPEHMYISASYQPENGDEEQIGNEEIPLDQRVSQNVEVPLDELAVIVSESAEKYGVEIDHIQEQHYLDVSYVYQNGVMSMNQEGETDVDNLTNIDFITEEEYASLTGSSLNLRGNEIAVWDFAHLEDLTGQAWTIGDQEYAIVEMVDDFPIENKMKGTLSRAYGAVVSGQDVYQKIYDMQAESYGEYASEQINHLAVTYTDVPALYEVGPDMMDDIQERITGYLEKQPGYNGARGTATDTIWEARTNAYSMYGTLLFLGIILGVICLFATALIIYYKQISEGHSDRERFQIMEKIGMSAQEVRRTIGSQIKTVFFLPLLVSAVHMAVAFPIINKLLHIFMMSETMLFVKCTLISIAIFAIIYLTIYLVTAKMYYRIVHDR